ncbi:hypothetical protein [Roseibacillus persicicus]|uniref:hypothetical protein n=1 Tax=Roseibacillus persicicus TaxID=454148 RepID=UPI00280C9FE0|nr:hypothetical protein [Roseibacillus persicicus]MDQ8190568.1 hypothetical protein [Roseibacillus persicicus]
MNRKLIAIIVAALAIVVGLFVLQSRRPAEASNEELATKSGFSTSDSLPGFKSRRDKSERVIDPAELEPLHPPIIKETVVLEEGQRFEDLSDEERAKIEEQQREIATLIARNNQEKFEVQVADLVKGLELDAAQENELRSYFEGIQARIAGGDLQAYGDLEKVLNSDGLEEILRGVLTSEQLEVHQATADRLREQRAEQTAAVEFEQVTSLLSLTESQKTAVKDILRENALQQGGTGQGAGMPDVASQAALGENLLNEIQSAGPNANPLAIMMQQRLAAAREQQLKPFEGVLSAEQLDLYRQSLEVRDADLSRFQNSLNAFSANQGGAQ